MYLRCSWNFQRSSHNSSSPCSSSPAGSRYIKYKVFRSTLSIVLYISQCIMPSPWMRRWPYQSQASRALQLCQFWSSESSPLPRARHGALSPVPCFLHVGRCDGLTAAESPHQAIWFRGSRKSLRSSDRILVSRCAAPRMGQERGMQI